MCTYHIFIVSLLFTQALLPSNKIKNIISCVIYYFPQWVTFPVKASKVVRFYVETAYFSLCICGFSLGTAVFSSNWWLVNVTQNGCLHRLYLPLKLWQDRVIVWEHPCNPSLDKQKKQNLLKSEVQAVVHYLFWVMTPIFRFYF